MQPAGPSRLLPILGALLAIQIVISWAAQAAAVLAPLVAAELGVPASLIGLYVAGTYAFSALSGLFSGPFIRRYGALRVSQICLALAGLSLVCGASAMTPLILLGAVFMGTAYGPATPASSHLLARASPPDRVNIVFSIKQTGVPFGAALAGATLPGLALAIGWKGAAVAVGVLSLVLALAIQPMREATDADRDRGAPMPGPRQAFAPLFAVLADPGIRMLALTSLTFSGMQVCLGAFLVTYLNVALGFDVVFAGLMLSCAQVGGVGGRILWGWLADRLDRPQLVLAGLGFGMSASALLAGTYSTDWPILALATACLVYGGTAVAWNGVFLAQVARHASPARAGEITGGTSFFTYGGVTIVPAVFSAILAATGSYAIAFAVVAVPTTISGLAFLRRG
ncbi:MAG: MFS transporter [Alphaproteobacteria bacterium]|nr:MFS transporter [Alphaproteobacteria bacterium]